MHILFSTCSRSFFNMFTYLLQQIDEATCDEQTLFVLSFEQTFLSFPRKKKQLKKFCRRRFCSGRKREEIYSKYKGKGDMYSK
jgi:hypothetical protein